MSDYISRQMHSTNLAKVGTNLATKRTVKGFPIDADLLMLKVEEKYGFRARDRLYEIIRYMSKYELPAEDVVPVVRCKDCVYCDKATYDCHNNRWGNGHAYYPPPVVREDGFCMDGEKRKE